jgi:glycosyltransferase involved in cell wall biosynthesis
MGDCDTPVPTVSVVIASHNYARFLPDAIGSVMAQTYADWECVIVDDASTDDTCAVVNRMVARDPRFRYVKNGKNLGEAGSRNLGNRLSRGRFVAALDADDWWHPEKLRAQMSAISPDHVLGFTGAVIRSETSDRLLMGGDSWANDLDSSLRKENLVPHSSVLVRRDAVLAVGGYRDGMPPAADWDLWLRLLYQFGASSIFYVRRPLVYYRVHGSNMSSNHRRMTWAERRVMAKALTHKAWALRHPKAASDVIGEHLYREIARRRQAGRIGGALRCACGQVLLNPLARWRWKTLVECCRPTASQAVGTRR